MPSIRRSSLRSSPGRSSALSTRPRLTSGMLAVGRSRASEVAFPAALALTDAQKLGFSDAAFDSVCFSLCLCTIPDPALAAREALRVARPGAPLLFLEHVRSHLLPVA